MNNVYGYTNSHDKVETISKSELENDYYKKAEVNTNFYTKNSVYTKSETNTKISNKILSGTSEPSSSLGENGAIYIKYGV